MNMGKTLFFLCKLTFFECYAIDNEKEKVNTYAFYKSADIMNIQVISKKAKKRQKNLVKIL